MNQLITQNSGTKIPDINQLQFHTINQLCQKFRYLLILIVMALLSPEIVTAQTVSNQTYTVSGYDDAPTVLTITKSSINVNQSQPIQSLKLVNAANSLLSTYCSSWYNFNVQIDGVAALTNVCGAAINNLVIPTTFNTLTITSTDLDNTPDFVTIAIDLQVTYQTPSCFTPTALTLGTLNTSTANFTWTAPSAGIPNGGYSWVVVSSSGSPTSTPIASGTSSGNSASATGLSPNTAYKLFVKSICGIGDSSIWSSPLNFMTLCNPYTVPYAEGFESGYTDLTAIGGCLSQVSISGANSWMANSTNTTYNRTPRTGNFDVTLLWGNEDYFFIPINLTGGTAYRFQCYAKQDGSTTTDANIAVKYGSSPTVAGMTYSIVNTTGINTSYLSIQGNFTPSTTGTYYIGVKGYMNSTPYYITLDDISVNVAPSCLEPSNPTLVNTTTTTAKIKWTAPSTGIPTGGYSWVVVAQGAAPTATPVASGSASVDSVSITGLTAGTSYQFYIRSKCSASDSSVLVGPFDFNTMCTTANIPFSENFDNVLSGLPNCWSQENSNGDSYTWGVNSSDKCSGNSLHIRYNSTLAMNDWAFSPIFTLTAGTSYRLTFNYSNNSDTYSENLELYVGTSQTQTAALAGTLLFRDSGMLYNSVCNKVTLDYTPTVSGDYSFGWHGYSPIDQFNLFIDNVTINLSPTTTATTVANNNNNDSCTSYILYGVAGNDWHYLLDAQGNTVVALNPNGGNLGNVSVKMKDNATVNTSSTLSGSTTTLKLMPRYYSITPTKQPTGNTSVRLYYLGAELDAMNATVNGVNATNFGSSDIQVYKYTVTTPDCDYSNNGSNPLLVPQVSTAVGPTTGTRDFYSQFDVSSFSEFVGASPSSNASLALDITKFAGHKQDGKINLSWNVSHLTAPEDILVQKFVDQKWITIGTVPTEKEGSFNFSDVDVIDINVYRLAYNNKFTNTISIKSLGAETISIFPNPAFGYVYVDITTIAIEGYQAVLYDMVGRKVMTQNLQPSSINKINVASLPTGNYMIKIVNNGTPVFTQKLLVN